MHSFFLGHPCPQMDRTISSMALTLSFPRLERSMDRRSLRSIHGLHPVLRFDRWDASSSSISSFNAGEFPGFSLTCETVFCHDPQRRYARVFLVASSTASGCFRAIRPLPAILSRRTTAPGAHQTRRVDPQLAKETHRRSQRGLEGRERTDQIRPPSVSAGTERPRSAWTSHTAKSTRTIHLHQGLETKERRLWPAAGPK